MGGKVARYSRSSKRKREDSVDSIKKHRSDPEKETMATINSLASSSTADNQSPKESPPAPSSPKSPSKMRTLKSDDKNKIPTRAMCRMFFPSSGHMGFDTIKVSSELPPVDTVREMITYETRLRLSEPIQELMDLYHKDENSVSVIHDVIQQHVVERFGYHDVNALRTAVHRFPDDPIVQEAFYVKHNRVTQGLVSCGDEALDIDLFTLEGHPTKLFSQISPGQPLVILAGSGS